MAVSDQSGGVLYRFVYDTYGELSDIKTDDGISLKTIEKADDYTLEELAQAAGFTYLYNGQYGVATDKNGLYYMRARYYDQDIKRFINRDIISGDISNSKSLNRYAYVQGNPVSLTDPFGLCPDSNSSARLAKTLLCDTDWSAVGHTALDIVGIFWDGADFINMVWYAAEDNAEMAIKSAIYAIPGMGMAGGKLLMTNEKLKKAGKAVCQAAKFTQGVYGLYAGMYMAGIGIGNIYNCLKNGEKVSFKYLALVVGGAAITYRFGKTLCGDMQQMFTVAEKVNRTAKVGNMDASHEPVPEEKKILEAAESGNIIKNYGQTNQTLLSGEEWYRYFQETYGANNVTWNVNSFGDMVNHPTSLRGYSADEIGQVLGDGWTKGVYGTNGSGWKFIEDAHPDNMVFYHGGGGDHVGAYWGVKSGKTGTIKVVDTNTYVPKPEDKAKIIFSEDW